MLLFHFDFALDSANLTACTMKFWSNRNKSWYANYLRLCLCESLLARSCRIVWQKFRHFYRQYENPAMIYRMLIMQMFGAHNEAYYTWCVRFHPYNIKPQPTPIALSLSIAVIFTRQTLLSTRCNQKWGKQFSRLQNNAPFLTNV